LALKTLLKEAPYITFNRIFQFEQDFFKKIGIYKEKRLEIRMEMLEFIDICIQ
jgi:hypothetical protein